jgi:chromosome segregation ATPase
MSDKVSLDQLPLCFKKIGEGLSDFIRERDLKVKAELSGSFASLFEGIKIDSTAKASELEAQIELLHSEKKRLVMQHAKDMAKLTREKDEDIMILIHEKALLAESIVILSEQANKYGSLLVLLKTEQGILYETRSKLMQTTNELRDLDLSYKKLKEGASLSESRTRNISCLNDDLSSKLSKLSAYNASLQNEKANLERELSELRLSSRFEIAALRDQVKSLNIQLVKAAEWGAELTGSVHDMRSKLLLIEESPEDVTRRYDSLLAALGDLLKCVKAQDINNMNLQIEKAQFQTTLNKVVRQQELERTFLPLMHAPRIKP